MQNNNNDTTDMLSFYSKILHPMQVWTVYCQPCIKGECSELLKQLGSVIQSDSPHYSEDETSVG